jgi:hypothetical protein
MMRVIYALALQQLTLTASNVEPMAIKLEINRAQNHTLRGEFSPNNADGDRVEDGVVVEVAKSSFVRDADDDAPLLSAFIVCPFVM